MALEEKINSLDEITKESTIDFFIDINLSETKMILEYLAKNLPADIKYNLSYNNHIFYNPEHKQIGRDYKNGAKITGTITSFKKTSEFAHDSFEFKKTEEGLSRFNGIKFQTIPGYNLDEHRPEIRNLWKDVREIIDDYFED